MKGYYYLHTNGDLIWKPAIVVDSEPEYFKSPFVKCYWSIETEDRGDAWTLVIEALARGARIERIKELATKWKLTAKDLKEYIVRNARPNEEQKEGMGNFIAQILNENPNTFWDYLEGKK